MSNVSHDLGGVFFLDLTVKVKLKNSEPKIETYRRRMKQKSGALSDELSVHFVALIQVGFNMTPLLRTNLKPTGRRGVSRVEGQCVT